MTRRAGDGLREHAAGRIEYPGGEVARLAYRCAERGTHQGLRLLLDHRDQPAPHDLRVQLGQRGIGTCDHDEALCTMDKGAPLPSTISKAWTWESGMRQDAAQIGK